MLILCQGQKEAVLDCVGNVHFSQHICEPSPSRPKRPNFDCRQLATSNMTLWHVCWTCCFYVPCPFKGLRPLRSRWRAHATSSTHRVGGSGRTLHRCCYGALPTPLGQPSSATAVNHWLLRKLRKLVHGPRVLLRRRCS